MYDARRKVRDIDRAHFTELNAVVDLREEVKLRVSRLEELRWQKDKRMQESRRLDVVDAMKLWWANQHRPQFQLNRTAEEDEGFVTWWASRFASRSRGCEEVSRPAPDPPRDSVMLGLHEEAVIWGKMTLPRHQRYKVRAEVTKQDWLDLSGDPEDSVALRIGENPKSMRLIGNGTTSARAARRASSTTSRLSGSVRIPLPHRVEVVGAEGPRAAPHPRVQVRSASRPPQAGQSEQKYLSLAHRRGATAHDAQIDRAPQLMNELGRIVENKIDDPGNVVLTDIHGNRTITSQRTKLVHNYEQYEKKELIKVLKTLVQKEAMGRRLRRSVQRPRSPRGRGGRRGRQLAPPRGRRRLAGPADHKGGAVACLRGEEGEGGGEPIRGAQASRSAGEVSRRRSLGSGSRWVEGVQRVAAGRASTSSRGTRRTGRRCG